MVICYEEAVIMDDNKIIELLFARSEQALVFTQEKYGRLCGSIARGILANNQDAEECVNDSYIKLWNAVPPKCPQSLCGYLCTIVRNTALTAYERTAYRSYEQQYDELAEIIPDSGTVEARFESGQLGCWINEYLAKQSRKNREVFISRYYFNMSISDTAAGLSISEGAVKTRLSRVRAGLKKYLQERGVEL